MNKKFNPKITKGIWGIGWIHGAIRHVCRNTDWDLMKAMNISISAHEGQIDKGGSPYIEHVVRVSGDTDSFDQEIIAILHDVLEDSPEYRGEILSQGFNENVISGLEAITKKKCEPYNDYIERVGRHKDASIVKLADLKDNMDTSRLGRDLTAEDIHRLNKYIKAREYLICKVGEFENDK